MKNIIEDYPISKEDKDLNYTEFVAYQKDKSISVPYDISYFQDYVNKSGTSIANKLNETRVKLTEKYCNNFIVDIGIGSGEFIESSVKLKVYGFDINPIGVNWLKKRNLFFNPYIENSSKIEGFSLWDVLEHIPNPDEFVSKIICNQLLFISIPVFDDFDLIKSSKHYKPNEHYYYFNTKGLIKYLNDWKFECLEVNDNETKAGREGITTFVFRKQ